MKTKILVLSHGTLAQSLVETSELFVGKNEQLDYLCLQLGEGINEFSDRLASKMKALEGNRIIILVDLLSGSPFNAVIPYLRSDKIKLITGVNLPILLELLTSVESADFEELENSLKAVGVASIVTRQDIMKGENND